MSYIINSYKLHIKLFIELSIALFNYLEMHFATGNVGGGKLLLSGTAGQRDRRGKIYTKLKAGEAII